jgi:putative DNA-invertase from lambdoid prophage Rac
MKVALYARVSTHDQQTLPMQLSALRDYAQRRGWTVALRVEEVGSGASQRPQRDELLRAARLDRWGRSLVDLVTTLARSPSSSTSVVPPFGDSSGRADAGP